MKKRLLSSALAALLAPTRTRGRPTFSMAASPDHVKVLSSAWTEDVALAWFQTDGPKKIGMMAGGATWTWIPGAQIRGLNAAQRK